MMKKPVLIILLIFMFLAAACSPQNSTTLQGVPGTVIVSNGSGGTVVQINAVSGNSQPPLKVGSGPTQVVVSSTGLVAYVVDTKGSQLFRFNPLTQQVKSPFKLPGNPIEFQLSPADNFINGYALMQGSNQLVEINMFSGKVVSSINVGQSPTSFTISNSGVLAFVTDSSTNTLNVVDLLTKKIKFAIPVDDDPSAIALTPNGGTALVVCTLSDDVVPVNLNTFKPEPHIITGPLPSHIIVDPQKSSAFVSWEDGEFITPINLIKNIANAPIDVKGVVKGMAVSNDGLNLYLAESNPNRVLVIPTYLKNTTFSVDLSFTPTGIASGS